MDNIKYQIVAKYGKLYKAKPTSHSAAFRVFSFNLLRNCKLDLYRLK